MQVISETDLSEAAAEIIGRPSKHSIHDRLRAYLSGVTDGAGYAERLGSALATAASQLEYLTPAVLAPTRAGLQTGMATQTPRGALLFVLAEARRCVTWHVTMPAVAAGFAEMVEMAAVQMDAASEATGGAPSPGALTSEVIKRYGATPGQLPGRRGSLSQFQSSAVLGALLAPLARAEGLTSIARTVEQIRDCNFAPALVALVGPSSDGVKGHLSFVWPLVIAVAEYSEAFMARADAADGG